MWLKCSLCSKNCFFSLLPAIFFELPITRTFFDFPWRFELSGVNCISLSQGIFTFLWFQLHKNKRKTKLSKIKNWQQHKSITLSLHWKRKNASFFNWHCYWKFVLRITKRKLKFSGGECLIERFHSRGQHLCKFIGTKEGVCIRKEFNSLRIALGHQHGRRFIVLGHQYGRRDVMWKHSIPGAYDP